MATTTRREALQWVGGAVAAAMLPLRASAQAPAFPKGAVIRTLFKDYAPEELAGGATLFHEHLSLGPDFSDRFRAAAAAVLAAKGAPPAPASRGSAARARSRRSDARRRADGRRAARPPARRRGVHRRRRPSRTWARDLDFVRAGLDEVGHAGRRRRRLLLAAVLSERIPTMSEEQIVRALIKQADEYPGRRVRRDRLVGRDHGGRAQGVSRDRQGARRHEPADLHAHRHPGKGGARAARHPRGRRREPEARRASATWATWWTRTSTCTRRSAGAARSSASIARVGTATRNRCRW